MSSFLPKLLGFAAIIIGDAAVVALVVFIIAAIMAFPTMWLVNYLIAPSAITAVFGISQLTFWKAFWLNFLCGIIFKSSSTSGSKDK